LRLSEEDERRWDPLAHTVCGAENKQLASIEIPTLVFTVWPEQTPIAIDNAKPWAAKHGRERDRGSRDNRRLLVTVAVIGSLS
jgi:hypothetical protein